jgi:ubiquinone/menaquinone biosynthesis C-methylase UbiE
VLGLIGMKPGCRVLDLCCGDGFYAYHFYSSHASRVVAVDYDAESIRQARRNFRGANIEYVCADIRTAMPEGSFDNVAWDAGIDFFSASDIALLLGLIRQRLAPGGVLSGCAPKLPPGRAGHVDQRSEFTSAQALAAVLRQAFANVTVIELPGAWEGRNTLWFYASDGPLPLDAAIRA